MRIVTIPKQPANQRTYANSPSRKSPRRNRRIVGSVLLIVLLSLGIMYSRPLPQSEITLRVPDVIASEPSTLNWPAYGQSSFAAANYGLLETNGIQKPLSTASIAKVITALCILEKHPLKLGQQGPVITMTEADVQYYRMQVQQNGSRLYIEKGTRLSQYKALQALMLPSANNIADTLAVWGFGSQSAYQEYANQYLRRHGLLSTYVGQDASGLDPSTRSTASDLAKLGLIATDHPVLSEIASQSSAIFPIVGEMTNYNALLSNGHVTGIKTGNNDENPGAFLFSAPIKVGDRSIMTTGAVMGAADLQEALRDAEELAVSGAAAFEVRTIFTKGDKVGTLTTAWGEKIPLILKDSRELVRYKTHAVRFSKDLHLINGLETRSAGTIVGQAGPQRVSAEVQTTRLAKGPSIWWRLTTLR